MPDQVTDPQTLTLHAVRLVGFGDVTRVASRFEQKVSEVDERLLDFEACGWVLRSGFADVSGWSLTERGRVENERRLAEELDAAGARAVVQQAYARFLPLNARLLDAVTRWQIRPLPGDPMAVNDHEDFRWDDRVIETLGVLERKLKSITDELITVLVRFDGYAERFRHSKVMAIGGAQEQVAGVGVDSCHEVWMEFHEDLIATLGLKRGEEEVME